VRESPDKPVISPDATVGDLLEAYPALESVVTELFPSFAKLRTPEVRTAVARSLTLEQAAVASNVSLPEAVRRLRQAAGFAESVEASATGKPANAPAWVKAGTVSQTIDARPMLAQGQHPKSLVIEALSTLQSGQVLLLIVPFVPGPLIELGRSQGFETWTRQGEPGRFETYFGRME
jgi:hypothetical protein